MRNIAIVETNETSKDFLSGVKLSKDIKLFVYEEKLFKTPEFLLSKNSILIIEQHVELKTIDLDTLRYFGVKNTIFLLSYNVSSLCERFKKEYSLLKPSIGLIREGNTITRFGVYSDSSSY